MNFKRKSIASVALAVALFGSGCSNQNDDLKSAEDDVPIIAVQVTTIPEAETEETEAEKITEITLTDISTVTDEVTAEEVKSSLDINKDLLSVQYTTAPDVTELAPETVDETILTSEIVNLKEARSRIEERYDSLQSSKTIATSNLNISTVSVSCLKITWDAEDDRTYSAKISTSASYAENITFVPKGNGLSYLTGLRENSEYTVEITPNLTDEEISKGYTAESMTVTGKTEQVTPLAIYEQESGRTGYFAGEKASGLTLMPSSGAIAGSIVDPITDTGIRRNKYGDYCCAMGLWYGVVGERFLIELDNGTQFTVEICDSKGMADDADGDGFEDGRFHWFGGVGYGKCIVEFIYDDDAVPACVMDKGSWGYWNWGGLNLGGNVKLVQKIAYGNEITY
jgi:hypothetical protein